MRMEVLYMKGHINSRIIVIGLITTMLVFSLTACGNKPNAYGSMKSDDGRSYGGLIEGTLGDTLHTAFFDFKVVSAKKCNTYQFRDGLYIADPNQSYLEVTVTVTNKYDKDLPMSISDFTLDYSENDSQDIITGYGNTELGNSDFMDNIFTLKTGESITKSILFIVDDRAEYLLCYKEYYEDEFVGDSFEITMVPEVLEPAVTTEEPVDDEQEAEDASTEEGAVQEGTAEGGDAEGGDTDIDTGIIEE